LKFETLKNNIIMEIIIYNWPNFAS